MFLNGEIEKEIYIEQPKGRENFKNHPKFICIINGLTPMTHRKKWEAIL